MRFGELGKVVPGLSDRLLSQRLREREDEGLVEREVEAGTPVRVTYSLTATGEDLEPAIRELKAWARRGKATSSGVSRLSPVDQPQISLGIQGRPGPDLPGPFAVGRYANAFKDRMRELARVLVIGEVTGMRRSKAQAYFELRDGEGAIPCAIWLNDLERAGLPEGALRDGAEVVLAG